MKKALTIGKLIYDEVKKQGIKHLDFADRISCSRSNVFNIFQRNNIDIDLLRRISEVLNRNFFQEIANDLNLANEIEETEIEASNRIAVSKFLEFTPDIMKRLNKPATIVFTQLENEDNSDMPDFGMPDLAFTFTIGNKLKDRIGKNLCLDFVCQTDDNNNPFEIVTNHTTQTKFINFPVFVYSEQEWEDLFKYVFTNILK